MDSDVAYILGLIGARGQFVDHSSPRLLIRFPFKKKDIEGLTKTYNQEVYTSHGLLKIKGKFDAALGVFSKVIPQKQEVILQADFFSDNIAWRTLRRAYPNQNTYEEFDLPKALFDPKCHRDIVRAFIRGYCDIAATVRKSNADQRGMYRVYIDVIPTRHNWDVPVQLCTLLQGHLGIPVSNIIWGHPNTRGKTGSPWKEHQLRVFAHQFTEIGFEFTHKNEILHELANFNKKKFDRTILDVKECPGHKRLTKNKKPASPEERNKDRLPKRLVGKHFDAFWQVCQACGCKKHKGLNLRRSVIGS